MGFYPRLPRAANHGKDNDFDLTDPIERLFLGSAREARPPKPPILPATGEWGTMLADNREPRLEYGQILRLPFQETTRRLVDQISSRFLPSLDLSEIRNFRATIHFLVSFKRL